jgi:HAD superfamily hydrolase (TIGR01490 family)
LNLTLFDLDHTLLPIDSDYAWGSYTTQLGWTDPDEFARRNDTFYEQYKAGTLDIHEYVRFATDAVRRRGAEAARTAHADFMKTVVLPVIHESARALVQQHKEAGDEVLIVTATNEFVTRPIAEAFGVQELIAVELERDSAVPDGWFTGAIKGTPSFREGKVQRVEAWLAARQLRLADVKSTFYTDSINDLPLMEKVTHPVATNPDARLRDIATQRGWRILELFTA